MTLLFNVGGRFTARPGAYQESIENTNVQKTGVSETGTVAVIGTGKGIYPPKVPREKISPNDIAETLVGGDLKIAAELCFEPSPNPVNRGCNRLITCKVNPATQSTFTLQSGASANLLDLKTIPYGSKSAGISFKLEDGKDGAFGKKMTVYQPGKSNEVLDNIGYQVPAAIKYTGDATTALMTINETSLAVVLTGQTDGSLNLTAAFSTFENLQDLANFVNQQAGYEMVVFDPRPNAYNPVDLDYVSGVEIKEETGTLTVANDSAVTFTGTITGLDDNDVLQIGNEYLFVSDAATPTVIRGYGGTLPTAHTAVASTSLTPLSGVNKALIDALSTRSQRLSATRNSANAVGVPSNVTSQTYLSGGGDGVAQDADWKAALDALKPYKVNFIVLLSDDPVHHEYLNDHMNFLWGIGNSEAQAFTGLEKNLIQAVAASRVRTINNKNISFSLSGVKRREGAVEKEYPPYINAAINGGLAAGAGIAVPIYQRSKAITGLVQNVNIDVQDPDVQDSLIAQRILVDHFKNGQYELVRDVTSWSNDDDVRNIQVAARSALAFTAYKVRESARLQFQPGRVAEGDALSIKSFVEFTLGKIESEDKAIVAGHVLIDGQRVFKPAFSNVSVQVEGNVTRIFYTIVIALGRDFIAFNTSVDLFQDVA